MDTPFCPINKSSFRRIPPKATIEMIEAGSAVLSVLFPEKTNRQRRELAGELFEEMAAAAPTIEENNPYPDLTARQATAFETLHDLVADAQGRRMPVIRELANAMGIQSNPAWHHVKTLEKKGYLRRHGTGQIKSLRERAP